MNDLFFGCMLSLAPKTVCQEIKKMSFHQPESTRLFFVGRFAHVIITQTDALGIGKQKC